MKLLTIVLIDYYSGDLEDLQVLLLKDDVLENSNKYLSFFNEYLSKWEIYRSDETGLINYQMDEEEFKYLLTQREYQLGTISSDDEFGLNIYTSVRDLYEIPFLENLK